jgi:cytochrome c peroxidase
MNRLLPASLLLGMLLVGCQQADRFAPERASSDGDGRNRDVPGEAREKLPPLSLDLQWRQNPLAKLPPDVPIEFVSEESDPETWKKLPKYWNDPNLNAATALLMPSPWTAVPLAGMAGQPVRIKVPAGLPKPTGIPEANQPTLAKWQLGRELFFDKTWLHGEKKSQSCADCHIPARNFTDTAPTHEGFNTPTLVNVVYNRYQFWDGRATHLEEVVQRTLEDERETERTDGSVHAWGGVIRRLRDNQAYRRRFAEVFGTVATQDNLGRAIATYLRTLLAGDSVYDRARAKQRARGGKELESADVEAVLTETDLPLLNRTGKKTASVAGDLFHGYRLFSGLDEHKLSCAKCHSGPLFTDGGFHNTGVGFRYGERDANWPESLGRYAHAPLGEKSDRLIGAFKTPTLRGLSHTSPYLHTGQITTTDRDGTTRSIPAATVEDVIRRYSLLIDPNPHLDPLLLDPKDRRTGFARLLDLNDEETDDLALFLRSLTGTPVDPAVASPPSAK